MPLGDAIRRRRTERQAMALLDSYLAAAGLPRVVKACASLMQESERLARGGVKQREAFMLDELVGFWDRRLQAHDSTATVEVRDAAILMLAKMTAEQVRAWRHQTHADLLDGLS